LLNYEQFSQTRCNLRRANENPMFRKGPRPETRNIPFPGLVRQPRQAKA
jgi:hypothetical protein